MATKYYALLTNVGAAKLANATALGEQVEITQMAVGDGNGALPTPNPAQTALVHELRRAPLNTLTIDPVNTNQIIAEQVIPEDVGGWWIREIGLYDSKGDLIAIANCAETYKPLLQEGSGRMQVIRVILIVSSTQAVTLKIDPSVVLATRQYVDDQIIQVKAFVDQQLAAHIAAADPHKQYAPKASPALTGTPTAPTAAQTVNNTQIATTEFVKSAIAALVASSPAALDTLNELAAALGNDPNFATTVTNALAGKQPLDSTLTDLSGKTVNGILQYLGLGSGLTGVVGAARNALMSVTAPSATATFTADELIVETGTGTQYRLNAFSQTINLGTVGAGGMDTGTAPASGYLAIYALFNPTTGARCLIGVNATAAKVPEIYGGAYMPAGYTASALISVVATNASSLILPFSQIARTITIGSLSVFNTTTASASLVTVNIASAVPKNAKSVKVTGNTSASGSSALFVNIYETSNAMGQNAFATTSTGLTYTTGNINLPVPQTIYANYGPAVTGFNQTLLVSGYTF
ncbi:TPA: phage tail protein [Enterobacter kobei]